MNPGNDGGPGGPPDPGPGRALGGDVSPLSGLNGLPFILGKSPPGR